MKSRLSNLCLIILMTLLVAGCSPTVKGGRPGQGESTEVLALQRGVGIDSEIRKRSDIMLNYIEGRIELGDEDIDQAIEHFEKALELHQAPEPMILGQLATLYLLNGDNDKALERSSQLVTVAPSRGNLMLHAGILEALGHYPEAISVYEKSLVDSKTNITAYLLLAVLYVRDQRVNDAVTLLERMITTMPDEAAGHFYLGHCLEMKGDLARAETVLEGAFKKWPNNERLSIDLVRVLLKRGKLAKGQKVVNSMAERLPGNPLFSKLKSQLGRGASEVEQVLSTLKFLEGIEKEPSEIRLKAAVQQIERNEIESAAQELILVVAARPKDTRARYYLGSALAASGRKKLAISQLMIIKPGEEMFVEAMTFASFILRQQHDLDRAANVLESALKYETREGNVLTYLIDVLREAERYREALNLIEDALEQNPGSEALLFMQGIVLNDLNRKEESHQAMEQIIKISPRNGQALNFVAYHLAEKGEDLPRALELVTRALQVSPEDGYFLDTLGYIQIKLGQFDAALETLSKAVSLTGEDVVIMDHYADALNASGKRERAAEYYRSALELARKSDKRDEREIIPELDRKLRELDRILNQPQSVAAQ